MRKNVAMRLLCAITGCAVILLGTGCTASTGHPESSTVSPLPPDPYSASALLAIAAAFNHDYDSGDYGPVYDRWDARSQTIITRADYIQRRTECPSGPQTSRTESASAGPHGAWLVRYDIDGQQLTDYWFYVHHRWVFDLVLSNPGSAQLYRLPPAQYVRAIGCTQ